MRARFGAVFGSGPGVALASAPGRVNLIGEHTDYNDGFVLPTPIDRRIEVAARRRADEQVVIHSVDFDETVRFEVGAVEERDSARPGWSDYPRAVLWALGARGVPLTGLEMAVAGDVPLGAGLSSSAALEVATALALQTLWGFELDGPAMACLCRRAENDYVGVRCGIMDQFVARMGREGHALLLDCRSLEHRQVPLALGRHCLLVCNSRVKHSLVDSAYNERRRQCEKGVEALKALDPTLRALRDVAPAGALLETARPQMGEVVYRRCRHVVSENARVSASVVALERGDLVTFGALMNASHDSLRDDYEVSCPEIDLLVDLARALPGTLGARITGGGFGGSTVNLMSEEAAQGFVEGVVVPFEREVGHRPEFLVLRLTSGRRQC